MLIVTHSSDQTGLRLLDDVSRLGRTQLQCKMNFQLSIYHVKISKMVLAAIAMRDMDTAR